MSQSVFPFAIYKFRNIIETFQVRTNFVQVKRDVKSKTSNYVLPINIWDIY